DDRAGLSVARGRLVGVGGARRTVGTPRATEAGSARSTEKEACLGFHRFLRRTRRIARTLHGFARGQKSVCLGSAAHEDARKESAPARFSSQNDHEREGGAR